RAEVASRRESRPFSFGQWPRRRSASRAGLAWPWVRLVIAYTTTVRHRRLPRSRVLRVTWMTCPACGKPKWLTVTALRVRSSTRPWGAVAGPVQDGDVVPGQALAAVQERGLVGLNDQQVVGLLSGDQEGGGVGVGVQRVGGDHGAGQLQVGQQRLEAGDLTRGAVDVALGEDGAGGVVHRGEQVDLAAVVALAPRSVLPSTATAHRRCCWLGRPGRSRSVSHAPITAASAVG